MARCGGEGSGTTVMNVFEEDEMWLHERTEAKYEKGDVRKDVIQCLFEFVFNSYVICLYTNRTVM